MHELKSLPSRECSSTFIDHVIGPIPRENATMKITRQANGNQPGIQKQLYQHDTYDLVFQYFAPTQV